MRRLLTWVAVGVALSGLATLALTAAGRLGTSTTAGSPPGARAPTGGRSTLAVAVQAEPVQRRAISQEAVYYGVLEPRTTVRLAPRLAGRVAAVRVRVGDRVKAGQELMQLETAELEVQVQQSEAALAQAQARYERLRAGPTAEELEQARAAVTQAEAQLTQARKELERTDALRRSGAATEQAYDSALSRWQQSEAQLQAARARLESLQAGPNTYDLAAARAEVQRAEAALRMARLQLTQARLLAPVDGTVADVALEVGESASPSAAAVTLVDVEQLRVVIRVPGEDALRLRPQMAVTVQPRALADRTFAGRIQRIDPVADPQSHLFGVEVRVPNQDQQLRAGLDVTVRIPLVSVADALAIPEAAVARWNDQVGVFVVEGDRVRFQPVQLGIGDGTWRQVLSGLQEGQQVVTAGKEFLEPGAAVQVAGQE